MQQTIKEKINKLVDEWFKVCPNCDGKGLVNIIPEQGDECEVCHGTGKPIPKS
jgi:DnaJ-class molecular chaperone